MKHYVEMSQYFTDKTSFFISGTEKTESVQEFEIKLFE